MKNSALRAKSNGIPILKDTQKVRRLVAGLLGGFLLLAGGQLGQAYTQSGNLFTTDGSFADTQAAVYAASNGCTVQIPAGNFTWGHGNDRLYIASAITLQGQGTNNTIITLPPDSMDYYGNGVITFDAPATVQNLQIFSTNSPATAFTGVANGWRITGVLCTNEWGPYYVEAQGYGLIDHCTFIGASGTDEMIFCYGPGNSWQTPDSLGTSNAVVVENCVFTGSGYVCDANANARIVVRFCTITGPIKIDGHGVASDSPPRAVRQMEAYYNLWTSVGQGGAWDSMEIRGGTGIFFSNTVVDNTFAARGVIDLKEYGCLALWPNFNNVYQTPTDYPINDQVGVGEDPKAGGGDPDYLWNNTKAGVAQVLSWAGIPAGAIAQYTNETGNVSSTFTMQNIIEEDRDYFNQTTKAFDGSTGVGVGTMAQMQAITATKTNVGFWATDVGNWNNLAPTNHSGQLYTWNGAAWALKYVPLTYPFGSTSNMYVPPLPGPPIVNADDVTAYEDTTLIYSPLTNDADVSPGGHLTIVQVAATNGTATTDGTNITFTPTRNFLGTASVRNWVSDNVGYTNTVVDEILVTNLPPGVGSPDNPTLWYQFWGNTLDSSAHKNDGTSHTNMVYGLGYDGMTNHAAGFSGNGTTYGNKIPAYVQSPKFAAGVPPTNWSMSVWFKPSQIPKDNLKRCVTGYAPGYGVANGVEMLLISNGVVCGSTYTGSNVFVASTYVAPTNAWTHAVLEQDYLGNLNLFVNGLPAGSVSGGPTYLNNQAYFFVGGHGAFETDFAGAIADVRLFNNYALSAPDVALIYATGLTKYPPTPPGLLRVITSH